MRPSRARARPASSACRLTDGRERAVGRLIVGGEGARGAMARPGPAALGGWMSSATEIDGLRRRGSGGEISRIGSLRGTSGIAGLRPNGRRQISRARSTVPFSLRFDRRGGWRRLRPVPSREERRDPPFRGSPSSSSSNAVRRRCNSMINALPCGPYTVAALIGGEARLHSGRPYVSLLTHGYALSTAAAARRIGCCLGPGTAATAGCGAAGPLSALPAATREKISWQVPNAIDLPS